LKAPSIHLVRYEPLVGFKGVEFFQMILVPATEKAS